MRLRYSIWRRDWAESFNIHDTGQTKIILPAQKSTQQYYARLIRLKREIISICKAVSLS